ncbi:MAG: reverse transcriptase-like protein [Leptospirales bacterium]|nr:reverse transcriptase-like protein [Leptospirales bacterium]
MLLSIDRILQLISEGKNIEKIAELAECDVSEVVDIIQEARKLLSKHEKVLIKRKVILKKKNLSKDENSVDENDSLKEILSGAELSVIPINTTITMYIGAVSNKEQRDSGIGIIIFDQEYRQVGKVSDYIGKRSIPNAERIALLRAVRLALYFQANELKIKTNFEKIVKQLSADYKSNDAEILKFLSEITPLINKIKKFKIEYISKNSNDKANFLAEKAIQRIKKI